MNSRLLDYRPISISSRLRRSPRMAGSSPGPALYTDICRAAELLTVADKS